MLNLLRNQKKSRTLLLDSQQSNRQVENNQIKEEEENEETNLIAHVKLRHIAKILDDMAYLTGSSLMTYMEYIEGVNVKKTTTKAKDELTHYFWKKIHEQELELLRKNRTKNSIYKSSLVLKGSDQENDKNLKVKKDSSNLLHDSKPSDPKQSPKNADNEKDKKETKNKNGTNNKNDDKQQKEDQEKQKLKQNGKY